MDLATLYHILIACLHISINTFIFMQTTEICAKIAGLKSYIHGWHDCEKEEKS